MHIPEGEEDEGRSQRAVANGRAMLALNGRLGTTGVCGMKKERATYTACVGHTQVQVCLTYIHSTVIAAGIRACRRDRKWDREATQR